MRRAFAVVTAIAAAALAREPGAFADPSELRFAVAATRTAQEDQFATDRSRIPGPGVAFDWLRVRSAWHALGVHLAWSSGFNSTTTPGMPSHEKSFDSLVQLHFLFELRRGPVAFGIGTGIDLLHRRAHFTDPVPGSSASYTKTEEALGAHVQLGVEVAQIESGTFSVVAAAGLFSLAQLANLCGGEVSCARQATTLSLGVAFRPR